MNHSDYALANGLKHYLEKRIDGDLRGRIMRKHNLREDDLDAFEDLVQRTQNVLLVGRPEAIQFLDEARTRTGDR